MPKMLTTQTKEHLSQISYLYFIKREYYLFMSRKELLSFPRMRLNHKKFTLVERKMVKYHKDFSSTCPVRML